MQLVKKRYNKDMKKQNTQSIDGIKRIPKTSENPVEFNPYKGQEYRLFLIWRTLPLNLRGVSSEKAEDLGVKDSELAMLMKCKTLGDFSEEFGISRDTLTDWKKKEIPEEYQHIDWRYWAREFTSEVVGLLLEGIREKKKADAIKLWFQTVDGFVEETSVNNKSTEALDAVKELIGGINAKAVASESDSQEDSQDEPATS